MQRQLKQRSHRLAAALAPLALLATASAQSWDQRATASGSEPKLASGLAASATTFAFGQPQFDPWGSSGNQDQVRVWELQGGSFAEVAVLTSAEPNPSHASYGVALDLEGDLLVVGDPGAQSPGFTSGVVHVYRRAGGGWTLEQVLRPTAIALSALEFGKALDLEGNRLAIGAPTSSVATGTIEDGAVYVFEDQGAGFVEVQRVDNPSPINFGGFGRSVALDAGRLLAGASGAVAGSDGVGYLFEDSTGGYALAHTFLPSAPFAGGGFGGTVALSGSLAAFSSPGVVINNFFDGRVTVFEELPSGWTETAVLEDLTGLTYNHFGSDLEFEGGSLFVTSEATSSAQRFDQGPGGWTLAERYITAVGFTWGPKTVNRIRSVAGRVILTEPGGATVFPREVAAELEVNCAGEPHPLSATGFPVILDVKGQIALSEGSLPMTIAQDAGTGPGVLFYGFAAANKPFGSSATLCVQAPVARAMRLNAGVGSFELDLGSKPITGSANAIPAGTEAYFQYWFRIPGGLGTHLSNSLRLVFAP